MVPERPAGRPQQPHRQRRLRGRRAGARLPAATGTGLRSTRRGATRPGA
jgi:hypothetical protein